MTRPHKVLLTIIFSAVLLQGCINVSRAPSIHARPYSEPTIGQELIDLDKARVSGAISGAEFELLKAKILENED